MPPLAGQKTWNQIQTLVGQYLFGAAQSSDWTNPDIGTLQTMINDKYRELCSRKNWWFLFDSDTFGTVPGTHLYAMADKAQQVILMSIPANELKLTYMNRADFFTQYPAENDQVGRAIPFCYIPAEAASNNALQFDLFPTPDKNYRVLYWYKKRINDMDYSVNGTYPVIPPEWQDVLVHLVCAEAFAMINPTDPRCAYHMAYYERRFREMWLFDEQVPDGMNAIKDANSAGTSQWPGLVHPYLPGY